MIFFNDKVILDTSGGIVSSLYDSVEKIIYEEKLYLKDYFNEDIVKMLEHWFLSSGSNPFDIADYIHTKKDLITFTNLVRKGINRFYKDFPNISQYTIDSLENFHKELVEAQKTFPK